jgi:PAS domain S-box-containing protein
MATAKSSQADSGRPHTRPSQPSGLLDRLSVAAVVLDTDGRIVFWSPQAEELFGYTPQEALGEFAGRLLVHEQDLELVIQLFAEVMESGQSWAGAFPIRHKDGSTRLVEFRNMRLLDDVGDVYALGIAADHSTLEKVERDLALSERLVAASQRAVAVVDNDLHYVLVNHAMERLDGLPAADHLGRHIRETLPFDKIEAVEAALRQAWETEVPQSDQQVTGHPPADPDVDHNWSVSFNRLEDVGGRVIGVAFSVLDITEQHRAATEAAQARRRLGLIAEASARVGTTLDVDRTARELAEIAVPELADVVSVDVLDSVLAFQRSAAPTTGPEVFRALALVSAYPTEAARAADPPGELASYGPDRVVTQCVQTGRPILIPHVDHQDLQRIARDADAAALLAHAGVHSYLAIPLVARGEVLGAVGFQRARNPQPFDEDDATLAGELAARAAVCIDNARWFQSMRNTAVTLQRSLLPQHPSRHVGLDVASRYEPAHAYSEVGGDWFDVIPLNGDKTALVVGDVMGSGIDAAATMGRLRTATSAFADLDLTPDEVLQHLDKITCGLEHYIATCLYAVYDPHREECHLANAGHLPPVLVHAGGRPELLDLPTGAPLGVGGVSFERTTLHLGAGDRLVLYTDGLVETRDDPIDERLNTLLQLLDGPRRPLEETADLLLQELCDPEIHDDVALLIAQMNGCT